MAMSFNVRVARYLMLPFFSHLPMCCCGHLYVLLLGYFCGVKIYN